MPNPFLIACALVIAAGLIQWAPARTGIEEMWARSVEAAAGAGNAKRPDYFVSARPANVVWGGFPIDEPPVLTIDSGTTVRIDTISQSGAATAAADPVTYFGQFGVQPAEVLQDVIDFWNDRPNRPQYGPHILTGPIYVNGAEPGDVLEIQILDLNPRVPYGLNSTAPMGGVLGTGYPGFREGDPGLNIPAAPADAIAGLFPGVRQHLYRVTKRKGELVALFSEGYRSSAEAVHGCHGSRASRRRLRRLVAHLASAGARRAGLGTSRTVRRQHGPARPHDWRHACICRSFSRARSSSRATRTRRRVTAR